MKQKLQKISLSLGALLLLLGVVFTQQAYAGDGLFSNFKRFDKHTYVGPFPLAKKNRKQAKSELTSKFAELEQTTAVQLIIQDFNIDLPTEVITFDVDATVDQAVSGKENSLVASVSREGLRTVLKQNFSSLSFNDEEIENISSQIESQLRTGIMPQHIYLAQIIPDIYNQAQTIASASYATNEISQGLRLLINDLNEFEIEPNSTFSFQEFVSDKESVVAIDQDLSIMASLLYESALQTNWVIDERSIGNELTVGVEPGFEAVVNRKLDLDLQFTNPNQTMFTLRAEWKNSQITLSIEGLPFVHTYQPQVESLRTYNPKTVVQYSAFASSSKSKRIDKGKQAMEVKVMRSVLLNGSLQDYEDISVDFYLPKSKIERRDLIRPEPPVEPPADDSNTGSGSNTNSGSTTDGGNSNSGTSQGNSSTNGSGTSSGSTGTDGNGSSSNTSNSGKPGSSTGNNSTNGSSSGTNGGNSTGTTKPSGNQNKDDVYFDKGGNPVDKNGNPLAS
ncbi:VanW family protein [Sporosarcina sp. PTS2304]|uniref:VanW family protein n=1 Tax=Sporosarcina sp. PTS2304 TaxID=2283194 RepID=UPI0013B37711|nr:VanW family protein [Sporosarcina sp. PTS2304]